ncbi:MAG: sensor histidine kinase [Deferribacterales bacterium]
MSEDQFADFRVQHPILTTTLDTLHEIAIILDFDRNIIYFNKKYDEFALRHGLNREKGIKPGNAFNCIRAVEGDEMCGTTDFCRYCGGNSSIEKSLKGESSQSECQIVATSGKSYNLKVSASPLNLRGTDVTLYCIMDISSETRKKTLEKIFFHDVNNIVGGVSMLCEMLADNCDTKNPDNINNLGLLRSAIDSLKSEIDSQRIITMAEKDELKVRIAKTCVASVLDNVVRFFKPAVADSHITIVNNITEQELCIDTDLVLIKRVLVNMIKNACEASAEGQTVTIDYELGDENLTISVHNPSVMPEHISKSIFKRSFSTKGEGRGLGTYSMRLLTERYLKGSIYFTSIEDEGTTFFIELPIRQQDSQ